MSQISGAQLIVRLLERQGVRTIADVIRSELQEARA